MLSQELQKQIDDLPSIQLGSRAKDLTGQRHGSLTYLKPAKQEKYRVYWWVLCDCGNIEQIRADHFKENCKVCSSHKKSQNMKGKGMQDLSNQQFGKLTALYPLEQRQNNKIVWHCRCECGTECNVLAASLTSKNTQSCGCLKKEKCHFVSLKTDLTNQRFGYLTALEPTSERQYGKVVWKCQCDCGNIVFLNTSRLTSGNDTSCGCRKDSLGVITIANILQKNDIQFKQEYTPLDLPLRRFDFVIYDLDNKIQRFVEYDGEQHFKSTGGWNTFEQVKQTQKRDQEKNEYALSHNIPLVRIPYWERDNITLDMIMGDQYLVCE